MSPFKRSDVESASLILPRVVDQWRKLAMERAARCVRVQGVGVVRQVFVAQATNNPVAEERAYENVVANLASSNELRENRFRADIVARTFDDRFVFAGRAVDESGHFLRNAEITIRSTDDPTVVLGTVKTDDTGRYILDGDREVLDRIIAAGGGITETIAHERLSQPTRNDIPVARLDPHMTDMSAVRHPTPFPGPRRPRQPVPIPTPIPSRPVPPVEPDSIVIPLTRIDGIGPQRRARLETAGITDLAALAAADPARVGELAGVSAEMAKKWMTAAKRLLRSNRPG